MWERNVDAGLSPDDLGPQRSIVSTAGCRLESVCTKRYRGFESHSLRHSVRGSGESLAYGRAKATTASPRRSPRLPCPPAAMTTYCRSPAS